MQYISTRLKAENLGFKDIILQGLAADGGLYVPEYLPQFNESDLLKFSSMTYPELFFEITKYFVGGEIEEKRYKEIIDNSYKNFSHSAVAPLKQISHNQFILELFHGPTLAFKDFALQFLGNLLQHLLDEKKENIAIIGATSGDTGSAAISGCMKCDSAKIFILHPLGKVSEVQRRQMTTIHAHNVYNIAIEGNFDDCQSMVKKMFADQSFLKQRRMVAVNSINWARIMAQIVYYFYAALRIGAFTKSSPVSFSVPTGNFGDIYAGFIAKRMGLAIDKLIIATNSNDILTRFLNDNDYSKKMMVETISPSMNIQISSNFERMLFDIYRDLKIEKDIGPLMAEFEKDYTMKVSASVLNEVKKYFLSYSVDDEETKKTIKNIYKETSELLDPHTAIGIAASKRYVDSKQYNQEIVVNLATAHPAKFEKAIIDCGFDSPKLPNFLKDLLNKEEKYKILENDISLVKKYISNLI